MRELSVARSRNPLLLAPKGEFLTTFADPFSIDRGLDVDKAAIALADACARILKEKKSGVVF